MRLAIVIVGLLTILFFLLASAGLVYQWSLTRSPLHRAFISGNVPNPLLEGFYKGTINLRTSWKGKTFDSATHTGHNVFLINNNREGKYNFTTSVEKGVKDKKLDVLRLDYNVRGNHPLLRLVMDEIVEDRPNHYVGKARVMIPPGIPFTVAFFELEREDGYGVYVP